ncbi:hypothetical protein OA238_c39450 [Octadecabacter arcticus 238]|jgi:hypothetical protein|uniref:Uncharacterized protein n=1 Tax=Octadecabacter arcticus 238 TaxID=391616 RepID=M9RMQ1_9RHOB|nr:hypothetical protein [Octadecabacter arcticus]AGI73884.1 hypothetical protein OA238_c39450 [Octadecabacter arcticus 238]
MVKHEKPAASASKKDACDTIHRLGRELHAALFPEEYDHMYDSVTEAKDRLRGINPMNAEYVEKTNALRTQLINVEPDAFTDGTLAWVLEKLRQGDEAELREIMASRAREALEAKHRRERARQHLQTPSWLDQRIDGMLSGETFTNDGQDRTDPHVIAFRVLGELYTVNLYGNNKLEFFRQIRRLLAGRSEAEYQDLYRHVMNEWMDVYDY